MKKQLLVGVLLAIGFAGNICAATINDDYIGAYHGYNQGTGNFETYVFPDVIGNPKFDISKMEVTVGRTLKVDVFTAYTDIVSNRDGIRYGDLFLSNNGYNPTVPTQYDHQRNGEFWEYALVLDNNTGRDVNGNPVTSGSLNLYAVNSSAEYILAENAGSRVYRAGQEVLYNTRGQVSLGTGLWATFAGGISFEIDSSLLTLGPDNLGLRWAMTCANDIIEGSVPIDSVPEPATMLLFGAGLAGLAGLRRKK